MTKKDYELIAKVIVSLVKDFKWGTYETQNAIDRFSDEFQKQNQKFDRARFDTYIWTRIQDYLPQNKQPRNY